MIKKIVLSLLIINSIHSADNTPLANISVVHEIISKLRYGAGSAASIGVKVVGYSFLGATLIVFSSITSLTNPINYDDEEYIVEMSMTIEQLAEVISRDISN